MIQIRNILIRLGIVKYKFIGWSIYQNNHIQPIEDIMFISNLTQQNYINTLAKEKRAKSSFINNFYYELKTELNDGYDNGFILINNKRVF